MKKIALMIGNVSQRGGLEKVAQSLALAFREKGCHVSLITTGRVPITLGDVSLYSLAPSSKLSLQHVIRFNILCHKWLKEHPQDLVFGLERTKKQDLYRAGSGVHKVFLQRRKEIEPFFKRLSFHLNPLHQLLLSYEKCAFEDPSLRLLFTNSKMVQEEILTHYQTDPRKIRVIHNGVDIQYYKTHFEQKKTKQGAYQFLFVGNGYVRKGLLFLLNALAELKEKEWRLSVVGKEKNLSYFKEIAAKLSLSSKIQFHGPQADLIPFYQHADALVIPSLYDPFANVTLEALAMGLFVISSPFNGGAELLRPHMGHRLESLFDRDAFVHGLKLALEAPRNREIWIERRESIKEWDLSKQLDKMVQYSLATIA